MGREAIKNANDGWRFYITDRLGSTRFLTDASGNITEAYTYTAYGETTTVQTTPPPGGGFGNFYYNPFLFTGQQFDASEGNYYLRNRYYTPAYGRFLVADPIRLQGGMNMYAYCAGNPINCVDPFGLETTEQKYHRLYKDHFSSGLTGADQFLYTWRAVANTSESLGEFLTLSEALFVPGDAVPERLKQIGMFGIEYQKTDAKGKSVFARSTTTGWNKKYVDYPEYKTTEQSHHLMFYLILGFHGANTSYNRRELRDAEKRSQKSVGASRINTPDITLGDDALMWGEQLRNIAGYGVDSEEFRAWFYNVQNSILK